MEFLQRLEPDRRRRLAAAQPKRESGGSFVGQQSQELHLRYAPGNHIRDVRSAWGRPKWSRRAHARNHDRVPETTRSARGPVNDRRRRNRGLGKICDGPLGFLPPQSAAVGCFAAPKPRALSRRPTHNCAAFNSTLLPATGTTTRQTPPDSAARPSTYACRAFRCRCAEFPSSSTIPAGCGWA